MKPGARIAAAIEVLETIVNRHQPVGIALADWGKSHRFAGSGDRNAIGGLVYDALRRRSSIAWAMGADTPRAHRHRSGTGGLPHPSGRCGRGM
jgi:16S rRNA (cytosine967-C5)-methyltransferase